MATFTQALSENVGSAESTGEPLITKSLSETVGIEWEKSLFKNVAFGVKLTATIGSSNDGPPRKGGIESFRNLVNLR